MREGQYSQTIGLRTPRRCAMRSAFGLRCAMRSASSLQLEMILQKQVQVKAESRHHIEARGFQKLCIRCSPSCSPKADYYVGQVVQRRDKGRNWKTGFVTSLKPLMVTVSDLNPKAPAFTWDEVRPIPEALAYG